VDAEDLQAMLSLRGLADRQARIREAIHRAAKKDSALAMAISAVQAARKEYHDTYYSTDPDVHTRLSDIRMELDQREAELNQLAKRIPRIQELMSKPDLSELSAFLSANGAALITASYTRFIAWDAETKSHPDPIPSVAGFLVLGDGSVQRVELVSADALDELCSSFSRLLHAAVVAPSHKRATIRRTLAGEPIKVLETGFKISSQLKPLLDAIPEATQNLWICPDGALASIPWGAVPIETDTLLEDKYQVRYFESLAAIKPRQSIESAPSLLAFGGIAFGGDPKVVGETKRSGNSVSPARNDTREWNDLQNSIQETESITQLFTETFPGKNAQLLTGREASKESFFNLAQDHRIIHLATHAWAAPESEWNLGRAVAFGGMELDSKMKARGFDRGLLSGIVFAGNNLPEVRSTGRGVITASELASMDLSSCELAVLSACQTNVGPRHSGEAVTGLNRALQLAGARYTVTSLWSVDDEGTAKFFMAFYHALWQRELSVPEAFEAAREKIRREGWGPAVWAGFVLYSTGTE